MIRLKNAQRRSILVVVTAIVLVLTILITRLSYLMLYDKAGYEKLAEELHERERSVKAERGLIFDRNGVVIAANKPVCTISVIHNQIKEPERVISELSRLLSLSEETVRKRVEKYSSIERIKSNVDKETADRIRELKLDGVMVDEDYKRYYPFGSLASKVLGFTGGDNQGIVGLEVKYENYLAGKSGKILTLTTAHGLEIENAAENRREAVAGANLHTSLDVNIQTYAQQLAEKVMLQKMAKGVSIIVMDPNNGEIFACVNVPEYDLNTPYELTEEFLVIQAVTDSAISYEKKNELLNLMWRNRCIHDTYEPGSAFKIVTATAALEEKVVDINDSFFCPGYRVVADRRIHCHKVAGHGSESFLQGIMNSCNPVFMDIGARVGVENFLKYFKRLGLSSKTGVDLPGEATSIMHKKENIGEVELATISFGQSFQITPFQLIRAASAVANGGTLVTPHFGVYIESSEGYVIKNLEYSEQSDAVSEETCETMRYLLEKVVSEGTGNKAYIEGYTVAGKTATSEKLPRSENKYIASFIGFAPAEDPKVIAMVIIDEPQGLYYGGTIAAPVIKELYENILPYMGIDKSKI